MDDVRGMHKWMRQETVAKGLNQILQTRCHLGFENQPIQNSAGKCERKSDAMDFRSLLALLVHQHSRLVAGFQQANMQGEGCMSGASYIVGRADVNNLERSIHFGGNRQRRNRPIRKTA